METSLKGTLVGLLIQGMIASLMAGNGLAPVPSRRAYDLANGAASNQAISITSNQANSVFPAFIRFQLSASSTSNLLYALLIYGTNGQACQAAPGRQALEFTPAWQVDLEWELDFSTNGGIPPGAEIWWQWELADQAGNTILTEKKTLVIQDRRVVWQSLKENKITLQWYQGGAGFGQGLMSIAQASLGRLAGQMGIQPRRLVWITVYASTEALRGALGSSYAWIGGAAIPDYSVILLGLGPADDAYARQVIPHELAHLLVGELTANCLGIELPTWLNEGLAVNAEGRLPASQREIVLAALLAGELPPLTSLEAGFSPYPDTAARQYAQSGLVVEYLLQKYGPNRLGRILSGMQGGLLIDEALQKVLGLNTHGLDAAWRASLGFADPGSSAVSQPLSEPTRTQVPTLALKANLGTTTRAGGVSPSPVPTAVLTLPATAALPATATLAATSTPTAAAGSATETSPSITAEMPALTSPRPTQPGAAEVAFLLAVGLAFIALLLFTRSSPSSSIP